MLKIYPVKTNEDIDVVRSILGEYLVWRESQKSISPQELQSFRKQLADLPAEFAEPNGCLLLAKYREQPVGCVGLRDQPFQGGLRPQNCQRQHILFLACGAGSANCIRKPRVHCMKNGNVILERPGRTGGHRVWKIQLAAAMVRKKHTKSYYLSN